MKRKYIIFGNKLCDYINEKIKNLNLQLTNTELQTTWLQPHQLNYTKGFKLNVSVTGDYKETYEIITTLSKIFNTQNIKAQYDYMKQKSSIEVIGITREFLDDLLDTYEGRITND